MPKIVKIPLIIIALLLGLGLIILALVQTSWFKNLAVDKATNYLSKELGVVVQIEDIDLDYFDRLRAHHVLIEDQLGDTMFYIKELEADYDLFSFSQSEVRLNNVSINEADINLGIPKGETSFNLQFLVNYFTSPSSAGKSSPILAFDEVKIINSTFHYFNKNFTTPTSRAFDENDMEYSLINAKLSDFIIIKDSLEFDINHLSGIEKSGLVIENLTSKTTISSTTMRFNELSISTPKSVIGDFLEFNYESYKDFSEFIDLVNINSHFDKTSIHTDDLALFSYTLSDYNELLKANGEVSGTIADLKSSDLSLSIGDHTHFDGKARLTGLPDIYTTRFDVDAKKLTTNSTDIAKLIELDPVPQEILNLGNISYTGTFNGFISDFETKANISTDVGTIFTQTHFTLDESVGAQYVGKIRSDSFNLGKMLNQSRIGTTSFDLDINGQGLSTSTLSSEVNGKINHFGFADYNYQNIVLNGNVRDELFKGQFEIDDPNFQFDFDGVLNIAKEIPEVQVRSNVSKLNLRMLGLDSIDNFIGFNGDINLKGEDIDDIVGNILLDSFTLTRNNENYTLKDVTIEANQDGKLRLYKIASDLLDVHITGDFLPSEVNDLIGFVNHTIYPDQFEKPNKELESKTIEVKLGIERYQTLFSELIGNILFEKVFADLSYNHITGKIDGNSTISDFKYDIVTTPEIQLSLKNGGNFTPINFGINTAGLFQNDSVIFDQLNANGFIKDGLVNFETTSKRDDLVDIVISGHLTYQNDSINVFFDKSKVEVYDKLWELKKAEFPNIIYANGVTEFRYFFFENGDEILFVDASTGKKADKINATLINFKLENLSPFLAGFDIELKGVTNGYIDISDREGFPIIESDLDIANLQIDNDTLGTLKLLSVNKDGLLAVDIDGQISGGLLNDMKIQGDIDFKNLNSPLNLSLTSERSNIRPFEKYLDGLASEVSGYSTSDIAISGPLRSPKLDGTMIVDSLSFKVDYLQTDYKGEAFVDIDYNSFSIKSASLRDRFGANASVSGSVSHKNFSNFIFDIHVKDLENFETLNTTRADNELFYGTAFADGEMKVTGPMDDILLEINAKSRKGTHIYVPLEDSEASGNLSYVNFVNLKEKKEDESNAINSIAGVQMDFNLEITNDAAITLVFDELLGDKIEAQGHGNLRMEVNTFGDFNMYGGLTIDNGNYNFTAIEVISKFFVVKPGGTLFWDGDPYNAKVNIEAIKRVYSSTEPLLDDAVAESDPSVGYTTIPVDCHLQLTGLLFEPDVTFDLAFPTQSSLSTNVSSNLNTAIERIKLDQEELNRQVFALLVLGSFVPPSFASGSTFDASIGAQTTGINSLSDFASSQINNWLAQLDTRWQVGVDYQQTTLDEQSSTELILSLKRKLLNDKLEFSASVDAAAQGSRPYDIGLTYKIKEDGNFKIKAFQKQASDPTLGNINSLRTLGGGLFYRYQFDKFRIRKKKVKSVE
ncbi:MAG: translocation/assembly module TamB domain-containing protein [Bacteroidia bacterium]